jgi:hypothetical protein
VLPSVLFSTDLSMRHFLTTCGRDHVGENEDEEKAFLPLSTRKEGSGSVKTFTPLSSLTVEERRLLTVKLLDLLLLLLHAVMGKSDRRGGETAVHLSWVDGQGSSSVVCF